MNALLCDTNFGNPEMCSTRSQVLYLAIRSGSGKEKALKGECAIR